MSDSSPARRRPANIVFIQTDSMDGRVMGCMGHPAMGRATPNIDALARRGVLFRNAYTNNPICCPSRASMWSGQYTHHCEGWNNYKGLERTDPTFRTHLDQAGYRSVTYGKTDFLSGEHTIRARVTAWARAARIMRPTYRIGPPRVLDEDVPRVHERDWADVDKSIDWLKSAAAEDRPFMLYLGIRAPHPGFTTSQMYLDMIDEAGVNVPPPDEPAHPVLEYQRTVLNWEHGFSEEMARKVRHVYFAMIAEVDAMVGKLLATAEELGLGDSTYFVFSSDHGEMAMEHRLFYKMNMYEASARIPLIVAGPGVRQGAAVDGLVSLVDIYPTLMDMAGLPHPGGLDGHSLMGELTGSGGKRPDWVLSEYHDSTCDTGLFMLRRGDWKYVAYVGCEGQLFNLADDPDEVADQAAAAPDVVSEMDARLREIVDYEAVDAKVKEYDRRSFRQWRDQQRAAGTYEQNMARIHSGWDNLPDDEIIPWTEQDEKLIDQWLAQA